MPELSFRLVLVTDGATAKLKAVKDEADQTKKQIENPADLVIITDGADGKLHAVTQQAQEVKQEVEKPKEVRLSADKALATVRDVKIAFDGVLQILNGLTTGMNSFLDEALSARQAMTLAKLTFGESAREMSNFANSMQQVTNFEGDQLLALMSKLSTTFKLNKDDIKALTPVLLDFTEANKATGMTFESAFDLMGKALNGHTEMLGRYGIELDDTRLKTEGVAYLVEKLGEDYNGTATALADLRLQNRNAWGDVKESIGDMLQVLITPLLQGLKFLMETYQNLSPVLKGFAAGLVVAVPLVVSITAAIVALTAAVHALKTAINPIAGAIGIIVGLLSAVGFGLASAKLGMDAAGTSAETMSSKIKGVNTAVEAESEKFRILASRLLALRSQSTLTIQDKNEMAAIIQNLNGSYSTYLGNINLETASYNQLAAALNSSLNALIQQSTIKAMGDLYGEQVKKIVALQKQLKDAGGSLRKELDLPPNLAAGIKAWSGIDATNLVGNVDTSDPSKKRQMNLEKDIQNSINELNELRASYSEALSMVTVPIVGSDANPTTSGASSLLNDEKQRYENLVKELADLMKSATQKIEEEYLTRKSLIEKYTADGSAEEKAQLTDLDSWKTAKLQELGAKEKALQDKLAADKQAGEKAVFEKQIQYYSNLENLGISSYDALKQTMSDYYAWAKQNLPAQEADLILAQMREANLKWGKHQAELANMNRDFHLKNQEIAGNSYAVQLAAIDDYYADRRDKLLEAGVTEAQITAQIEAQKNKIKLDAAAQFSSATAGILGTLANAQDKESEKGFKTWKTLAIAQALIDIPSSAIAAYKSVVGIPVVGPVLAVTAAGAAVAAGMANLSTIQKTKYERKAEKGMFVEGPSHSRGGVPIEVEGGEFITSKERVSAFGRKFYEFLNFAPLTAVKGMLAGLSLPSLSVPMPDYSFASGGYASSSVIPAQAGTQLLASIEKLISKIDSLQRPTVTIYVDPLTGKAVELSELVDTGRLTRSEI